MALGMIVKFFSQGVKNFFEQTYSGLRDIAGKNYIATLLVEKSMFRISGDWRPSACVPDCCYPVDQRITPHQRMRLPALRQ
jgi:hypothetical protein